MSMNLEQLIIAYLKDQNHYVMDDFKELRIHGIQADEVSVSISYGNGYTYRDDMTFSYTKLITWYIDTRGGK